MPKLRLSGLALAALFLLLQACAPTQTTEQAGVTAAEDPNEVPELTLNLPGEDNCVCVPEDPPDYTFLEKGFSALVAGDHIGAVQHFQRYQRLESSPRADWEAGIAIAYDSMLPRSPFYDPQAARRSYNNLKQAPYDSLQPHENILMMRDALETFVALHRQLNASERDNAGLKEDLQKREEALKRLRELTLGQKGARP